VSPTSTGPSVSVIIVSYNCRDYLDRCLAALEALAGVEHEVIVVDNASTDGTVESLRPRWPGVRWIVNRDNAGFARANNQGFAVARAPYWLVLNPDTEVRAGAIPALLAYIGAEPRVAVVGPEIERPEGGFERSAGFVPTLPRECVETFLLFRLGARGTSLRGPVRGPTPVEWLSGCAFLVRADAAREVGVFDERFFMYSEDLDWCYRFGLAGWSVVYLPGPRVLHHRGASVLSTPTMLVDGGVGLELFVHKHGLRFPLPALRALLVFKLATRALWLGLRGLRGNARARLEARLFARSVLPALGLRRGARR
jgi:hypothetical protein